MKLMHYIYKCKASQLDNLSMYYRIKGKHNGFCKFKKMFIAKGGGGMGCTSSGGNLRLKAIRIYVKSAPD